MRLLFAAMVIALSTGLLTACAGDGGEPAATGDLITPAPYTGGSVDGEQPPTEDPSRSPKSSEAGTPAPAEGRIITWADYDEDRTAYAESTVVLYFHAPWCSECQATEEAISTTGIPPGLVLVQIDYDTRTDLREEYGVTIQHSFVLVDDAGKRQDIWTETISGTEIAARAT
jgi:thiol-disulfide isomerase/thioredoxin